MNETPTALIHLDVHLATLPWKPTAFWAGLLGILLSWNWEELGGNLVPLLAFLVLVDPVWGAWWRLGTQSRPGKQHNFPEERLPYERVPNPYRWAGQLWQKGFWSGLFITVLIGFSLAGVIGLNAIWLSLTALGAAAVAWWLSYVAPRWLQWLHPIYGIGLPLWSGGYAFGHANSMLLWASIGVVGLLWTIRIVQIRLKNAPT